MASVNGKEPIGEMILRDAVGGDEMISKAPTVLSCGGIYIPRTSREEQRVIYHIITTSSREEPVKVMTGLRPRNALHEILIKESLN